MMMPLPPPDQISFEVLSEHTLADAARVIARAFAGFEPMAVASGISEQDVVDLIHLYAPQALQDGLTVVARDSASGRIAGAMLVDDFACDSPPLPPRLGLKFQSVWALLGELGERYKGGATLAPGQILHFAMLAVDRDYSGKKIAPRLIHAAERIGLARGYRLGVAEATSATSQHIFRQCGFIERLASDYRRFTFQGEPVFAGIDGDTHTLLMEKPLNHLTTKAHHGTTGTK